MDWYIVIKTIKGRRYRYRQKTWREGGRVRTRSEYIGPVNGSDKRFNGFRDLTIRTLESLRGKSIVSKQFISDLANSPDLKQLERELVQDVLASEGDMVDVTQFASHIKDGLLPLAVHELAESLESSNGMSVARYASVSLGADLRGDTARYAEHIFQSPIDTTAGDVHFSGCGVDKYFAHSRIEDMSDGQTRRVIEVQSDLFQKGRLEFEPGISTTFNLSEQEARSALMRGEKVFAVEQDMTGELVVGRQLASPEDFSSAFEGYVGKLRDKSILNRLRPYRNTWYERVIREEIKQAAKDGKTMLQFPTGETAMMIEGLGSHADMWETVGNPAGDTDLYRGPEHMKIGNEIHDGNSDWIITDVLGDGKFKAVPTDVYETAQRMKSGELTPGDHHLLKGGNLTRAEYVAALSSRAETFDISGKVDTSSPIYRFYEREVGKYLSSKFDAKRVNDSRGVEWWQVRVERRFGTRPVYAF
jgi:hypothetical protein